MSALPLRRLRLCFGCRALVQEDRLVLGAAVVQLGRLGGGAARGQKGRLVVGAPVKAGRRGFGGYMWSFLFPLTFFCPALQQRLDTMLPIQDVKRRLRKYEAATETHQVSARRMLNAAIERGDTALRTDAVAGAWKRLAGGGARENVRERMAMQETLEKLKGEEREISKVMGGYGKGWAAWKSATRGTTKSRPSANGATVARPWTPPFRKSATGPSAGSCPPRRKCGRKTSGKRERTPRGRWTR